MTKLQIVLFRDGSPGHEKQSMGILNALRQYVEFDTHEIPVEQKGILNNIFGYYKYIFNLTTPPVNKNVKPDLIIGTGSHTHIPLLSCKKKFGGYAVTCMSPTTFLRKKFDLCFVPVHDRIVLKPNIVQTTGPPNIAKNKGEIIPSTVFSATVSTVALLIPLSSKS